MPSLREELEERYAADIAAMLEAEGADAALAAMWQATLATRDLREIVGTAELWCSYDMIAGAVGECVRLVVDHARKGNKQQVVATLDVIERYSRGDASFDELMDAKRDTRNMKGFERDAVLQAVLTATDAAGDNCRGFDDLALDAADEAWKAVIDIAGEGIRDSIVDVFRRRIPTPSKAAFHAAHARRNS